MLRGLLVAGLRLLTLCVGVGVNVGVEVVMVIRSRVAQGRCGFVVGERVGRSDGLGPGQGLQSTTSGFIR